MTDEQLFSQYFSAAMIAIHSEARFTSNQEIRDAAALAEKMLKEHRERFPLTERYTLTPLKA